MTPGGATEEAEAESVVIKPSINMRAIFLQSISVSKMHPRYQTVIIAQTPWTSSLNVAKRHSNQYNPIDNSRVIIRKLL